MLRAVDRGGGVDCESDLSVFDNDRFDGRRQPILHPVVDHISIHTHDERERGNIHWMFGPVPPRTTRRGTLGALGSLDHFPRHPRIALWVIPILREREQYRSLDIEDLKDVRRERSIDVSGGSGAEASERLGEVEALCGGEVGVR